MSNKVTAYNGQLIIGKPEEQEEEPNEKTQSVIDWLEENEDDDD